MEVDCDTELIAPNGPLSVRREFEGRREVVPTTTCGTRTTCARAVRRLQATTQVAEHEAAGLLGLAHERVKQLLTG